MRSFSTDLFGQRSQENFIFSKRVSEMPIWISGKCPKIDENLSEWVRHGSPRAHIRRGRSCKLSDASGRLPDAPWGRFKVIFVDFGTKRGRQNLPENFRYIFPFKGPFWGPAGGLIWGGAECFWVYFRVVLDLGSAWKRLRMKFWTYLWGQKSIWSNLMSNR